FAISSPKAYKVRPTEQKLIEQSDLVFVTAQKLFDYCSQYNNKIYSFPFGVNLENYERARSTEPTTVPEDIKDIESPIIGYIGGIHRWIDQDLIKIAAETHPNYSFVFVGPLQTDVSKLSQLKNVRFLGHKEHKELPYYLNQFTAAIIPYLLTEYTKNVYPTKLNEYLAMGKPVVSTDLAEIRAFNTKYGDIVSIGKDPIEFAKCLESIIKKESDEQTVERRIQVASDNTWKNKIEQMSELIEEEIE
ncbi:unnamed protein product, partial [marine sediment metagenome]